MKSVGGGAAAAANKKTTMTTPAEAIKTSGSILKGVGMRRRRRLNEDYVDPKLDTVRRALQ